MDITVFGSGYVGLVVAVCFAEVGHQVVCMDVNEAKILQLQQGRCPIYEPGLESLLNCSLKAKRIRFTSDPIEAVQHGTCQFIAVGTPPDESGQADLQYVYQVAETIARYMKKYTIIIDKSTVPIGTADQVEALIRKGLNQRGVQTDFDVVSNPEFLREGAALEDFRAPDRIVLGVESEKAQALLRMLYAPFNFEQDRTLMMDRRSAELTKYAANALLATKISFMNQMANLAEAVGADIDKVRVAIGADPRIGPHFIQPGCGYGGSCFGKDVQALINTAHHVGSDCDVVTAVERANLRQKRRLFEKIKDHYQGDLTGKVFAVWGLAFKPETDDMRDAPSLTMLPLLLEAGAIIQAFDPQATAQAEKLFQNQPGLHFSDTPEQALEGANALIILTEWRLFKSPDFNLMKAHILDGVIFDGRNLYDPLQMVDMGIQYYGIGRGLSCKNQMLSG